MPGTSGEVTNILTFDIEDWSQSAPDVFHPAQAKDRPIIMPTERVVATTRRLLEILAEYGVRSTCFVLGTVAKRFPHLVREIHAEGHEVASHGYGHQAVYTLTPEELRVDLRRAVATLEDVVGERVRGYRAPYFSITRRGQWALSVVAELGLEYDASTFPLHRRYYLFPGWDGWPEARRFPHTLEANGHRLVELPTSTVRILGQNLPFTGGGFLRVVPFAWIMEAVRHSNRLGLPAIFYLHPHDLDAEELRRPVAGETPRIRLLRWGLNFRRGGNEERLRRLLREVRFGTVRDWLLARRDLVEFPLLAGTAREAAS